MGYEILKEIEFPWPIALTVRQHHERLDGSGYPFGLQGDKILLEARILAVADIIEAMASHRPYRAGLGIDSALTEIEKNYESRFDADVVEALLDGAGTFVRGQNSLAFGNEILGGLFEGCL